MVNELGHCREGPHGAGAEDEEHNEHRDGEGGGGVGALDNQHDGHGHLLRIQVARPQRQPVEQEVRIILVFEVNSPALVPAQDSLY